MRQNCHITTTSVYRIFRAVTSGNINNNSHDYVYGAVIMTKVIARVHPVHLINVD